MDEGQRKKDLRRGDKSYPAAAKTARRGGEAAGRLKVGAKVGRPPSTPGIAPRLKGRLDEAGWAVGWDLGSGGGALAYASLQPPTPEPSSPRFPWVAQGGQIPYSCKSVCLYSVHR